MTTPEVHDVHIKTLYKKIEELGKDCDSQHKTGLEAINRVHTRIDDFVSVLGKISGVNKDLQSVVAHQKSLDADHKEVKMSLNNLERQMEIHSGTIGMVHRIAWGVAGFICLALGGALLKTVFN